MKYLKMLGLAAAAAMALMAFVGASTAAATVLCKNTSTPCTEKYPVGTKGVGSLVGTAILESTGGTTLDTCTGSSASETLEDEGSASTTVTGEASKNAMNWGTCTRTTHTIAGGEGELHHISGTHNGTITARGFEVTVNTIFGSCVFGLGSEMKDWGEAVGGAPGYLEINALVPRISGPCPSEVRTTAKFVNTEPTAGYVEAG